jgi:hypothetical protein
LVTSSRRGLSSINDGVSAIYLPISEITRVDGFSRVIGSSGGDYCTRCLSGRQCRSVQSIRVLCSGWLSQDFL